jgi:hypothetical protein
MVGSASRGRMSGIYFRTGRYYGSKDRKMDLPLEKVQGLNPLPTGVSYSNLETFKRSVM